MVRTKSSVKKEERKVKVHRRPGRKPTRETLQIWAVDPFDAKNSSTSVLISMCIKEDLRQTMDELAARVSDCKDRPMKECLAVLREMLGKGTLGYFECDDWSGFYFRRWEPEVRGTRCEKEGFIVCKCKEMVKCKVQDCERCGWNPQVEKQRVEALRKRYEEYGGRLTRKKREVQ